MSKETSATVPDWSREAKSFFSWEPSRSLLASIRAYQRHKTQTGILSLACRHFAVLRHMFWAVITGTDIPISCKIEGGLLLPHPNGVVIHSDAIIGPNCLIFQQVTIGVTSGAAPIIEGRVDIGAGAKVLGAIKIGAHSRIGANAVVLTDIPGNSTAVGIPAKVLARATKNIG